jgi:hypothetical protein
MPRMILAPILILPQRSLLMHIQPGIAAAGLELEKEITV